MTSLDLPIVPFRCSSMRLAQVHTALSRFSRSCGTSFRAALKSWKMSLWCPGRSRVPGVVDGPTKVSSPATSRALISRGCLRSIRVARAWRLTSRMELFCLLGTVSSQQPKLDERTRWSPQFGEKLVPRWVLGQRASSHVGLIGNTLEPGSFPKSCLESFASLEDINLWPPWHRHDHAFCCNQTVCGRRLPLPCKRQSNILTE